MTNIKIRYPQIFDWLNFQDINVIIIIILMLVVAGFNMISGLLILILEKTNMIGILKALGSEDKMIRRIFIYQAGYLIVKGLFWETLLALGLLFFSSKPVYLHSMPPHIILKQYLLISMSSIYCF